MSLLILIVLEYNAVTISDIILVYAVGLNYGNNATTASSLIIVIMTRAKRVYNFSSKASLITAMIINATQSSGVNLLSPIQETTDISKVQLNFKLVVFEINPTGASALKLHCRP